MEKQFCPYCMSPVEPGEPCRTCGLTAGSYTPSPHHLPPGTILWERYLIGRVLGEGGFGITYIGCDLRLELKVAIKEYFPTDRASRMSEVSLEVTSYTGAAGSRYEEGKKRFLREARAMAMMDKLPVIVSVRDFFEVNNTAYIVMEYIEGTTFKDLVEQKGGRIPAWELLHTIEPLFGALSSMHDLGLIHRDISPENLMLEAGEVRLLDFGCARESAEGQATLTIALKHGYAPVEQYQSKGQGPWTDVYALAATIYYCLTGRKPPQAMDRLVEDELVPPRNLGVDLTEKQERALLRGLSTMQSRRYRSMEEFHTALYLDQPVPPPPPPPPPPPGPDDGGDDGPKVKKRAPLDWIKAHWQLTAGICAAALLCVTGLALWFSGGEGSPAPEQDGEVPAMNDEPPESDPAPADGSGQTVQTVYELTATNETSLYNLLENDTVGAIIIPEGAGFIVKQAVTLTKKLRVEPNASINFWNLLQVNEGGSVEIAGNVGCDGLLHVGGGSVNVKSKGSLWASMLWLEREEGMTCAEDGEINVWGENPMKGITDEYSYSRYVQVDEEALFANAATVRTAEDFIAKCGGGSPIVVEGNITVPDMVELRVPLRIAGGAALDASLQMEGGTIVNHGTLLGRIEMFGGQTGLARNVLVNQGTMDGELHSDFGTVINLGEIKTRDVVRQTGLVNLGTMEITGLLEIQGNRIMNGGTLTIAGEGLSLYGGSGLNNFGTITVEDGARLESCADFRLISGGLAVHPGGLLVNRGALWFEDAGQDFQLAVETGGEFRNDGVFLYREDSLDLAEGAVQGDGHRIPFSWYTDWGTKGDVRFVSNESGLRAALADDRCSLVIWNHDMPKINLNGGELVVTKGLVLQGADRDRRADFNTGGLTVSGENAFFIGNNVDFHGYPLTVENGAAALFDGEYFGTGDITVTDGGALYSAGGTPDPVEEREIVLSSGGRLVNVSGIVLNNCVLRIDGGFLFNYNNLELNGCQIENSGFLESYWACLRTDGDSSLVNRGEINIRGWEWMTDLDGELTNHGQMTFGGTHRISGSLVNQEDGRIVLEWEDHPLQAAGRLENLGTIQGARGAYVETVDGGVFTGNQVSYD